ncbi:uncharacterized protein C8Q71DRAFT_778853 [Rhodofomes roseus]|uniref:Uncharacterized protein n=1 Tax=Rhodofomes roseus TaxID=34475 RepID=A0ABQ8K4W9_9APHY|nr:uncharacterized protein C8Q71DRAFT_778853 [Rhodofomes roseus]KAH9831967.1 hypothetical protein C8Q71DRAFT_778853 [Rhodofomes roseus]
MVFLRTPPAVGIIGILLLFLFASDGMGAVLGAVLGEREVLLGLLAGTTVVTPLALDALEYARGLVRLLAVVRVYRVGVSDGAALRGGMKLAV